MRYNLLLIIFILLTSLKTNASENPIIKKDNPYIRYILDHPNNKYKLFDYKNNLLVNPHRLNEVSYIVTSKGIYYKPIGTGYLFEISRSLLDSQVNISRIDTTYYTGYNFLDYMFKRNDTIFSFGGQGFWNHNGQLRYFAKEKGEWELMPIQQWFPISGDDIVDIRVNKGKIYSFFLENKLSNIFTNQKGNITDSVLVFNMKNGSITNLGSVLPNIKLINSNEIIKIESDYGVLIITNGLVKLLDFENNKLLEWKNIQLNNLFNSSRAEIKPIIIRDTVLLYYNLNKLDSIILPISQFKLINQIYNPIIDDSKSSVTQIAIYCIISLACLFFIFFHKKRKYKEKSIEIKELNIEVHDDLENHINNDNINKLNSILDSNEIQLLIQILSNNNRISVEQLNYILGLEKKNMQVQKKNRSSIISSINIKFKSEYNLNDELIQRIKDNNDARNINYQINLNLIEIISNWRKKFHNK